MRGVSPVPLQQSRYRCPVLAQMRAAGVSPEMVRMWQGAGHSRAPSVFSRAAAKLIGEEGEAYDGSGGACESPEVSVRGADRH